MANYAFHNFFILSSPDVDQEEDPTSNERFPRRISRSERFHFKLTGLELGHARGKIFLVNFAQGLFRIIKSISTNYEVNPSLFL